MSKIQEIEGKTLFVTDSDDGRVEAYLEVSDYEYLVKQAKKAEKYGKVIEAELKGATKILVKKLVEEN